MSEPKHRARKRFGQNFLHDSSVIERILSALIAGSRGSTQFVEIGPGQGALTIPLLERLRDRSASQLTLVELDRDLVKLLQAQLGDNRQLRIVEADALQLDFTTLSTENIADQCAELPLQLFGNLPYNISTPLLFHLLAQQQQHWRNTGRALFASMLFMLQKEVVDRLCAEPGSKSYGRLSVMAQYYCQSEKLFDVPASAFKPQPKVVSSIVRLTPYTDKPLQADCETTLQQVAKLAFAQRRKTLRNNLSTLIDADGLSALDIDPGRRAETLAIEDFVRIANALPPTT